MFDDLSAPRALVLPPPYTAHWLKKGDVLAHACGLAPDHGAGTLVWHARASDGDAGRFDFAVVLEPETPLVEARRAFIVAMLALGDAVAAHCPPERAVGFGWAGEVLLDASRLGGMRLRVAPETGEQDVPDWIVIGVELIADRDHLSAPGSCPGSISLFEEEFEDPAAVLESFAAHLMLNFDRMTHEGFESVAARYAARLMTGGTLTKDGDLDGGSSLKEAVDLTPWRGANGPDL
ncbi:biotin/lipoate--protein ligase family protein [Yoonia sp. MH D7]